MKLENWRKYKSIKVPLFQVILSCGSSIRPSVVSVSEPSTCNYEIIVNTSLVCHQDAMLVFPTLSSELQAKWNEIEGKLKAELITEKVRGVTWPLHLF
jgi:N-acetylglucosamine-1-phosphate transferase gamma subunit